MDRGSRLATVCRGRKESDTTEWPTHVDNSTENWKPKCPPATGQAANGVSSHCGLSYSNEDEQVRATDGVAWTNLRNIRLPPKSQPQQVHALCSTCAKRGGRVKSSVLLGDRWWLPLAWVVIRGEHRASPGRCVCLSLGLGAHCIVCSGPGNSLHCTLRMCVLFVCILSFKMV